MDVLCQDGRSIQKDSGTTKVTTSSNTERAVIHEVKWLASRNDTNFSQDIILADSMNLLKTAESETAGLQPGRAEALRGLRNFLNKKQTKGSRR